MPRYHHEATEAHWPAEVQMTLALLLAEINAVREDLGLPPRTIADIRRRMVEYQRAHPPQGRR